MQQKNKIKNCAHFGGRALLRFVYTSNVGLAFSLSDAISIEIFPSFQIAIAGDSDNILMFCHLCKHYFKVHLHRRCGPAILPSDAISIENFLSPRN
jgi:hypothetical protein